MRKFKVSDINQQAPKVFVVGDENVKKQGLDSNEDVKSKREKVMNMFTALSVVGVVYIGLSVYNDVSTQWRYKRFQERVLGANFSKLKISATKDPCLHSSNSSTNPYADQLNEAQSQAAELQSWISMLELFPAIVTITLFGACTDRIGRKIFFAIPIIGCLLEWVVTWVVCFWRLEIEWVLIGSACKGACGSFGGLYTALFAYTADNTDPHSGRSLGMVIVSATLRTFYSICHVVVGYVIAEVGYMWPLAASCLMGLIGLLGVMFCLKETLHVPKDAPSYSVVEGMKSVFSFYVKDNPKSKYRRKDFILVVLVFVIFTMGYPHAVRTLYILNEPFCWNSKIIGYMLTISGLLSSLVVILVQRVLHRWLPDEKIVIFSMSAAVLTRLIFSVAQDDWMIYLGEGVSLFEHNALTHLRAILTRMVPQDQQGSLLSGVSVAEVAFIAGATAATSQLYSHTLTIWKGLTFLVLGLVSAVPCVMLIIMTVIKERNGKATGEPRLTNNGVVSPDLVQSKTENQPSVTTRF